MEGKKGVVRMDVWRKAGQRSPQSPPAGTGGGRRALPNPLCLLMLSLKLHPSIRPSARASGERESGRESERGKQRGKKARGERRGEGGLPLTLSLSLLD